MCPTDFIFYFGESPWVARRAGASDGTTGRHLGLHGGPAPRIAKHDNVDNADDYNVTHLRLSRNPNSTETRTLV